jgi:hypothetical protein
LIGTNKRKNVIVKQNFNFPSDVVLDEFYSSADPYYADHVSIYNTHEVGGFTVVNVDFHAVIEHLEWYVKNYDLTGWNTRADGSGIYYADKKNYYFSNNTELYAQWSPK